MQEKREGEGKGSKSSKKRDETQRHKLDVEEIIEQYRKKN